VTEREWRLRNTIDRLRDQLYALEARLVGEVAPVATAGRRMRFCGYCGALCHGTACVAHADLLRLDPLAPVGEPTLIYQ
jgi:hypothetical protein